MPGPRVVTVPQGQYQQRVLTRATQPTPLPRSEALATLDAMVGRAARPVPSVLIAEHVLAITDGADWPVVEAATKAILRRVGVARRDGLRVSKAPEGGARLGAYGTRVKGRGGERPYRTLLWSVEPFSGSCDCADFARSSLGLCKHLFAVLEHLFASPRKLAQARSEGKLQPSSPLTWDSVRPLLGSGDWLDRVQWASPSKLSSAQTKAQRHFHRKTGLLKHSHADHPDKRAKLVDDLLGTLPRSERQRRHVDPALVALLQREKTQLAWRARTRQLPIPKKSLGRNLYPYQSEGVRRFLQTGRLLLGDDMGLGKTTQAVAACFTLFQSGHVKRGLVITPASLKWQWQREWLEVTDVPVTIVDGAPAEREALYASNRPGFLILNYELLLRDGPALRAMAPDMVVLDEAQRIKNWATKTAAEVKSLRAPYRLVLTGTPMENRLDELASIYDWVDDLALEPKWRLVPQHALTVQHDERRREVIGARHLDTLRTRIAPTFLRRVRREVLAQLPARTDTMIPVDLTGEQLHAHDELNQPIARLIQTAKRRPLKQTEFLRLMGLMTTQRMICNGLAQVDFEEVWPTLSPEGPRSQRELRGLFSPKLEEFRSLVEELVGGQQRKIVVFSQWRHMLRLAHWSIVDVLAASQQRAVFFTGAESQRQRTRGVVEFHDDSSVPVMFLSDAGGVGLNLQRAASVCINLELPWNPAVLEQRIGRIYRLGQTEPVDVFNLVSRGGIESRVAAAVSNKRELFDGLFDGETDELRYTTSGSSLERIATLVEVPEGEMVALNDSLDDLDDDVEAETAEPPSPAPAAPTVPQLLGSLSVKKTPEGGLVLEAPPESAEALASLFGAMAQLLRPSEP